MFKYTYTSVSGEKKVTYSTANDINQFTQETKELGHNVLSYKEVKNRSWHIQNFSLKDKIVLFFNLANLFEAGMRAEAFEIAQNLFVKKKQRLSLKNMKESLQSTGSSVYAVFREDLSFTNVEIAVIRTADKVGNPHRAFELLANYCERQFNNKNTISRAMLQPIATLLLVIGMIIYMSYNMIPIFYEMVDKEKLTPTQLWTYETAMKLSAVDYRITIGVIVGFILVIILMRKKVNDFLMQLLFKFNRQFRTAVQTYRNLDFVLLYQLLITTSMPPSQILEFLEQNMDHPYNKVFREMKEKTTVGLNISQTMSEKWFIPAVIGTFKSSEDSGNRDKSMENLVNFLTGEVKRIDVQVQTTVSYISLMIMASVIVMFFINFYLPMMRLKV